MTEGLPSPLNSLRQYMHLISAFAHQSQQMPHVFWFPDHSVLQFDGFPILIDDYRKMGLSLLTRAEEALDKVLRGCKLTAFDDYVRRSTNPDDPRNWIHDSPRRTDNGYSFLIDKRNEFHKYRYALLQQFHDPAFNQTHSFYNVDVGGRPLWKPRKSPFIGWVLFLMSFVLLLRCVAHMV